MRELHRRAWLSLAMMLFLTISAFAPTVGIGKNQFDEAGTGGDQNLISNGQPTSDRPLFNLYSQTVLTENGPTFISTGDFNSDVLLDIVVASAMSNCIEIYFQQENGKLSENANITIPLPGSPSGMDAGDLNGDGKDDLIVSVAEKNKVYRCYQTDEFTLENSVEVETAPRGVVIADFDGDGQNDFGVVRYNPDVHATYNCTIELRLAAREFSKTNEYRINPEGLYWAELIVSGDFTGNGMPDVGVADTRSGKVVVYANLLPGPTPGEHNLSLIKRAIPINDPVDISSHKVDPSNPDKLLVISGNGGKAEVYYYDQTANEMKMYRNKLGLNQPTSGTMLDVDGNGYLDLLVTLEGVNRSEAYRTIPDQPYAQSPYIRFPIDAHPLASIARDFTGNGLEDLIIASNSTHANGSLTVYFHSEQMMLGNAGENRFLEVNNKPSFVFAGDFEGIGETHIATLLENQDNMTFFTPLGIKKKLTGNSPYWAVADSLRGMSNHDIAVTNTGSDSVTLYWGGDSFYESQEPSLTVGTSLLSPRGIDAGDISGNGLSDLVIGCEDGILVLYNSGHEPYFNTSQSLDIPLSGQFSHVTLGNFNNGSEIANKEDERLDIAIINTTSNRIEIYFQQEEGLPFTSSESLNIPPPVNGNITWLGSGFINGDDLEDLVIGLDTGKIIVYHQRIDMYYGFLRSSDVIISTPFGFSNAALGDLNDDGKDNIAIMGSNIPVITVYEASSDVISIANFSGGAGLGYMATADLNEDNRTDLLFSSPDSYAISIAHQQNIQPIATVECLTANPVEGINVSFSAANSSDSFSDMDTLEYAWDFGDGKSTSGGDEVIEVEHVYMRDGNYTVTLTVTDREGLYDVDTIVIEVADAAPEASFTVSDHTPLEGTTVYFSNTSESYPDVIVNWTWDFGDGNVAYGPNVSHVYMSNDTYQVTLTVTDEDGSEDSHSMVIEVLDAAPIASFTVSNDNPLEGTVVHFQDSSTSFSDEIIEWHWDFGDGNKIDQGNSSHLYASDGNYTVTLTVQDKDGSNDSASMVIVVRDSVPSPAFSWTPQQPSEGETVRFTDLSSSYDPLVQWNWSFGDGSYSDEQNPEHVYANNGIYVVRLQVKDDDGSVAEKTSTIIVMDTHPQIQEVYTTSGKTSFAEDEAINLRVRASQTYDGIKLYEWDLDFRVTFQADVTTTDNRTSVKYAYPGSYTIAVRVWDSDSFAQGQITVEVENVPPVASFSYQNIGGGKVVFDASLSWDTPSDYDDLEFRWNFDDGGSWTPYSNQSVREHPFSQDGKYNVTLQVKDDDGAIDRLTLLVTVDRTPPTVVLIDIGDNAVVGKPIIIKANVTDAFGLESVTLIYRIGNETWNVTMTPSGPGTVYTAQIPSQNSTGSVYFRIAALDRSGNLFLTSEYEIKVGEDSSLMGLYLMALAGSIAFLGVVLYVRRKAAVVDDVFVIFEDGCLLAHETRRLKPGMDDEVLSSMLVAVQSFVKDSFKDEEVTTLKRLDFGEKRILVEKGRYIYLAVVLHGEGGGRVSQRMRDVLKEIEERYTSQLTEWDGDLDKLRGIKQLTDRLLEIRALGGIPIIGRLLGKEKETSDVASEGGPEDLED